MSYLNFTVSALVAHNLSANRDRLASLLATANEYGVCYLEAETRLQSVAVTGSNALCGELSRMSYDQYDNAISHLRRAAGVASLIRDAAYVADVASYVADYTIDQQLDDLDAFIDG